MVVTEAFQMELTTWPPSAMLDKMHWKSYCINLECFARY